MMTLNRHIRTCQSSIWHSLMMLWLLLAAMLVACSGSSDSENETQVPQEPAVLDIYVYAPGQAVPTRGNEGQVSSDQEAERAVHTLQIWVFDSETHAKEAYFTTELSASFYNTESGAPHKFQLPLPDGFTNTADKHVDVFVLANVTEANCGVAFGEDTPYATLTGALLQGKFGLTDPVTSVPADGLPMSGVIFSQPIYGSSPAYRIGTASTMSSVKLVRMVSKVRFLFSCSEEFAALKINSVTLGEHQIPNQEYLFLEQPYTYEGNYYHIVGTNTSDYNTTTPSLASYDATVRYVKPAFYTYERFIKDHPESTAQDYEDLINQGVSAGHISETKVYLRESDQLLSGTITYQVKEKATDNFGDEKTAAFAMAEPAYSESRPYYFSRNHTWIVYGYLAWAEMDVVTVTVTTWTPEVDDHTLYNW